MTDTAAPKPACRISNAEGYDRVRIPLRLFPNYIGSEARGISQRTRLAADMLVKLPMRGGAESLNAAVAAGIMMYELTRS